jgi:hypothetical protein
MRRSVFIAIIASLALVPSAQAKGPISAEVCGADGCREFEELAASRELTMPVFRAQARIDRPPTKSSGWFEITMRFGDFPERFALLQEPPYVRAIGKREGIVAPGERYGVYGWLRLSPAEAAAHERLTTGLEPLPISELPDLRASAPDLAATVRAADPEGDGDGWLVWLIIAAGAALLGAVAFVVVRRRARAAPEPAR